MATKRKGRRHFAPEYKAEVVALLRKSGKTAGEVARDLDLTETSVRAWVRQAEVDDGKGPAGALTTAEREELVALRRENKTLRMDREILKTIPECAHTCCARNSRSAMSDPARKERPPAFWRRLRSRKKTWSRDCRGLGIGDAHGRSV